MDHGESEEGIVELAIEGGWSIPEHIQNRPTLLQGLEAFYNAFHALDTERSHQFGLVKIPWSSIQYYADVNGLDAYDTHYLVRSMDNAYLKKIKEKNDATDTSNTRETSTQRHPRYPKKG